MNIKTKTLEIISANPPISYKELVEELNRDLIDELQKALGELMSNGDIYQPRAHYYRAV